jgi:hypothetical protein
MEFGGGIEIQGSSGGGGGVPATRAINTTTPLTGGGDLSADRTLAVNTATNLAPGVVSSMSTGTSSKAVSDDDPRNSNARTPTAHGHVEGDVASLVGDLAGKVAANVAIVPATKTKVTYDAKGLVTAGADATTADIPDSTDKRYVSDAQLVVIGNTSGTNSGNETTTTIGALINGATDKPTPVDADYLGLMDSAAANILKKLSWANIKATLKAYFDTLYASISLAGRVKLLADKTYYVRTDGNDANDGSANDAGHAFLTGQHAVDVASALDFNGYIVTIQFADGTYVGTIGVSGAGLGRGDYTTFVLQGNSGAPSNVILDSSSATQTVLSDSGAKISLKNVKVTASGGSGGRNGVSATNWSQLGLTNVSFGACAGFHINANIMSFIFVLGSYTISGNATYHYQTQNQSAMFLFMGTVTLSGTPAFTTFANCIGQSYLTAAGGTFSGSATGVRHSASQNGIISAPGLGTSYFPGNAAGGVTTQGQYLS